MRRAYQHYIRGLVERVTFMESTARETDLRNLEAENQGLRDKLGEWEVRSRSYEFKR